MPGHLRKLIEFFHIWSFPLIRGKINLVEKWKTNPAHGPQSHSEFGVQVSAWDTNRGLLYESLFWPPYADLLPTYNSTYTSLHVVSAPHIDCGPHSLLHLSEKQTEQPHPVYQKMINDRLKSMVLFCI